MVVSGKCNSSEMLLSLWETYCCGAVDRSYRDGILNQSSTETAVEVNPMGLVVLRLESSIAVTRSDRDHTDPKRSRSSNSLTAKIKRFSRHIR